MSNVYRLLACLSATVVFACAAHQPVLHGQDDWEAAEKEAANRAAGIAQQAVFEMPEEQFDQWVFNGQDVRQAKKRLEALLALQIESVERVCTLSDAQRKKLQLAGHGDMKRFDESTEVVRKKFQAVRRDQNRINEIWEDIQPLQAKFQAGLFGEGSLFRRILKRTLDAQQSKQYEQQELQRRRFRYEAKIGVALATIENGIPFRDQQRKAFVKLLLDETEPPDRYGEYAYYVVLYKVASVPEEKLKPIFDDAQWRAMTQLFAQAKGMEAFLKRNGFFQ